MSIDGRIHNSASAHDRHPCAIKLYGSNSVNTFPQAPRDEDHEDARGFVSARIGTSKRLGVGIGAKVGAGFGDGTIKFGAHQDLSTRRFNPQPFIGVDFGIG
jgi:hypothetical protein